MTIAAGQRLKFIGLVQASLATRVYNSKLVNSCKLIQPPNRKLWVMLQAFKCRYVDFFITVLDYIHMKCTRRISH